EDLFTARNPDSADVEGAADGDERVPLADSSLESGLEAIATEGGDERERVGGTSRALAKRRGSEPEADVRAEARLHPDDIADETIAGSAGVPNNVDDAGTEWRMPPATKKKWAPSFAIIGGIAAALHVFAGLGGTYLLVSRGTSKNPTEK